MNWNQTLKPLRIFLIVWFFPLISCYNYLSEEVPIVAKPILKQTIPLISIRVSTPEGEKEKKRITQLYHKYLEDTGYFGRVESDGVVAPIHLEIYTSIMDEYENSWYAFTSTLFSVGTVGLLPAFYGERRMLRAKIYRDNVFITEKLYSQKHVTLYGLIFIFIWEMGIEDSRVIENNKEKNIMHNLVQDLNDY